MTIEEKVEHGYFAGCIKYQNRYGVYLMPIAYWILNMKSYDPDYDPDDREFVFRNNVIVVNDEVIPDFLSAIEEDKIGYETLKKYDWLIITFYIDFDTKTFISCFAEIEVEGYLPDESWKGLFDDPGKYITQII